jgi:hypothetical protein
MQNREITNKIYVKTEKFTNKTYIKKERKNGFSE